MNRKNKKFKGTVLFTVVSVMSILLIFLLGTLVLAASANKRTHKTYASTQAEFAARSAIESFVRAMQTNEGIAKAVEGLTAGSPMYVEVNLNSTAYGTLADLVDSSNVVHPHSIRVELEDSSVLGASVDKWVFNEDGANIGWQAYTPVKVTAIAELGQEQSQVVAYIRKKAPYEPKPSSIKGLQTVDGGEFYGAVHSRFTGGLGFGICKDDPQNQSFVIKDDPTFENDLTYINGSLSGTTSFQIHAVSPASGTVIMGSCEIDNNKFVSVDYDASGITNMSDVPYLYVEGNLLFTDKAIIQKTAAAQNAPFNIFCGAIWAAGNDSIIDADLYITSSDAPSITTNNGVTSDHSCLGNAGTSKLHSWTKSVVTGGTQQLSSKGGNIFSKGILELKHIDIDGCIRIQRDLILGEDVKILTPTTNYIICDTKVSFTNNFVEKNDGLTVYCNEASGDSFTYNASEGDKKCEVNGKSVTFKSINKKTEKIGTDTTYPELMEKEVITGTAHGDPSDPKYNKIVTSLDEVRQQLQYIPIKDAQGNIIGYEFDPAVYLKALPTTQIENECAGNVIAGSSESITVDKNCTFKGTYSKLTSATFKPNGGELWVVLDEAIFGDKVEFIIDDANGGTVNFFLQASANANTHDAANRCTPNRESLWANAFTMSTTSGIKDGAAIAATTPINVNWYGNFVTDNGVIYDSSIYVQNDSTFIGVAKCPYTCYTQKVQGAYAKVTYTHEYGKTEDIAKPGWIGSALFKTVDVRNDFAMLYAGASGGGGTFSTPNSGDYKIMYYNEY